MKKRNSLGYGSVGRPDKIRTGQARLRLRVFLRQAEVFRNPGTNPVRGIKSWPANREKNFLGGEGNVFSQLVGLINFTTCPQACGHSINYRDLALSSDPIRRMGDRIPQDPCST